MAKGRRLLEKKEDSLPGSHNASTVMVSPSLTRVRELVSKLAEPKFLGSHTFWSAQQLSLFLCVEPGLRHDLKRSQG